MGQPLGQINSWLKRTACTGVALGMSLVQQVCQCHVISFFFSAWVPCAGRSRLKARTELVSRTGEDPPVVGTRLLFKSCLWGAGILQPRIDATPSAAGLRGRGKGGAAGLLAEGLVVNPAPSPLRGSRRR